MREKSKLQYLYLLVATPGEESAKQIEEACYKYMESYDGAFHFNHEFKRMKQKKIYLVENMLTRAPFILEKNYWVKRNSWVMKMGVSKASVLEGLEIAGYRPKVLT